MLFFYSVVPSELNVIQSAPLYFETPSIVLGERRNISATNTLSLLKFMRANSSSCRRKRANPIFRRCMRHPFYKWKLLKCWVSGVSLHLSSEKFWVFMHFYISQLTCEDPSLLPYFTHFFSFICKRHLFFLNTNLFIGFLQTRSFCSILIILACLYWSRPAFATINGSISRWLLSQKSIYV